MTEELVAPEVLSNIARNILGPTLRLKRGEAVVIETWNHTLPWARALVVEARRRGVRPLVILEDEQAYWASVESLDAKELGKVGEAEWAAVGKAQGYVFLWGPEDRGRLLGLPSEKYDALTAYNGEWYQRASRAKLRGCRVEFGRATPSAARHFGVPLAGWQEHLLAGSLVDPRQLARDAARVAARLTKGKRVTVTHANGTHLELKLAGRKPLVDDAVVDEADVRAGNNMVNLPSGVVAVGVDESTAEGEVFANRASFPRRGPTAGGHWTFVGGRLTNAEYQAGLENFTTPFEAAGAGRDRPAFLSLGLNGPLGHAPNMEDQERGAVTVGIGGNAGYGGKTKLPFLAWLVIAGAHLEVDGRPLAADGEIL